MSAWRAKRQIRYRAKPMTNSITDKVVRHCSDSAFSKLPAHVVERTKMIIFDEVCCAIVGRELASGDLIAKYVMAEGGRPESTILGTSMKVPAALAALANGTAGHADEYDGTHVTDGHPGAAIVAASLAIAELYRSTGAELINAVALGYDISTRIIGANGGGAGLRNSVQLQCCYLHCFGAAASCSRLMSLNSDGIRHALALSAGSAGGLSVIFAERRHMSKALSLGQPAYAGVFSAKLASIGFEGNWDIFDTDHNPLSLNPQKSPDQVFADLGVEHAVMGANFKFFSAGYPIHAPIEATLKIMSDHGLKAEDIEDIKVHMHPAGAYVVGNREIPTISAQDMIALAMIHGHLSFDLAHEAGATDDPRVKVLRNKIAVIGDPEIERIQPGGRGARVEIEDKSGAVREQWISFPRGHSLAGGPTWDELFSKWDGIMEKRSAKSDYESFKKIAKNLNNVEDVSTLITIVAEGSNRMLKHARGATDFPSAGTFG